MNLIPMYAFIFIITFIILGLKLDFKKIGYLQSAGITFAAIFIGIIVGIIPIRVGKSGDKSFYIYNIYKTARIYGKGEIYIDVPDGLKKIIIHNGVEKIGSCKGYKKLTSVKIPNSVIEISSNAFTGCESLESIEIPDTVEKIGEYAFSYCTNLSNIKIPSNLKLIEKGLFYVCKNLKDIEIPESVEQIGIYAFADTAISEINIPDNTIINLEKNMNEYYSSYARKTFFGCTNLRKVNISENNGSYTNIDDVIFNKDKTKIECYPAAKEDENYVIPDTVGLLYPNTFVFCDNLKSLTNCGSMRNKSIYGCENLESIEIRDGVQQIEEYAIKKCDNLSKIYIPDSVTEITGRICDSDKNKITIYCSANSYAQKYAESYGYRYIVEGD